MSTVWIIFGDKPQSNGDNIYCIFDNKEEAEKCLQDIQARTPAIYWHIEEKEVYRIY